MNNNFLNDMMLAGFALAPFVTAIVQIIKIVGARVGLPEGYAGYINLLVSLVVVVVAWNAELVGNQAHVANMLRAFQGLAEAGMAAIAAFGMYHGGKAMNVLPPVKWRR